MLKNDYILKKEDNFKKEHFEILSILKEIVNDPSFQVTSSCFKKEFLNLQMTNNDRIKKIIESIKEKVKGPNFLNQNIFHLIKFSNKKTSKEKFILVNSINCFSIFFNEPRYILDTNLRLYNSLIPLINSLSDKYKLFSISNGKSNENTDITKNLKENESNQILTPDKFMEEIYNMRNENLKTYSEKDRFKFYPKLINFEDLKNKFKNLIANYIIYDDEVSVKKKVDLLNKVILEKSKEEIYPFIKYGIPHSSRKDIYKLFLNIQEEDFNLLKNLKETSDYLIVFDYLISNDLVDTCNNENYFLFEENLTTIMSKFLRDPELIFEIQGIRPLMVISLPGSNNYVQFPQCGIIPYKGITYLAAPFSYMTMNPIESYILFRKFFAYYLSHLSSINSNENSLSSLIYNFDYFFTRIFQNLNVFLKNYNIDINRIVIRWFMTCFAEIMNVNQVFILYDIFLTNKNMHFMIFLALGLCQSLEKTIMSLTSKNEILDSFNCFYELDILEVVKIFCESY